jgi:hypothetical protein
MIRAIHRWAIRNRIKAAKHRHEAIAALRQAIRAKDTRRQHEAHKAAVEATNRALRLGA